MKGCEHDKKQEPIHDSSEGGGSSDKGPSSARQFERDVEGGMQGGGEEGEKRAAATAGGAGERLQAVGADETGELIVQTGECNGEYCGSPAQKQRARSDDTAAEGIED